MKKMILLAAAAAVACLVSCKRHDPEPLPIPEVQDEVSVSPASVSFEGEGGSLKIAVTTNAKDFSVSGAAEWLGVEKSGKELNLTASANTVAEVRSCTLTLTAGKATCTIDVSQKAGSPFPGFTICSTAVFEYAGTMLYQFLKPSEEDYGGQGYVSLVDEDGNSLSIWIYTELFEKEEDVELNVGTYVKGEDVFPSLCGKKYTFVAGVKMDDDEDDSYIMGSYYTSATTEQDIALVDGTLEITKEGEDYTIKVDMTDAEGNAYKYAYSGSVEIDTESATYPGNKDRIDVASTVFAAECYYMGDAYENGTSNFQLYLYSGDEENPAVTVFEFNTEAVDFSEDMDISGEYVTPSEDEEEEEVLEPFSAGTLVPGMILEIVPGFEMPFGTYIMYTFDDYLLGDAYDFLSLEKQEDGTYTLTGSIMSSEGDFVMFMGEDFTGIKGLEIPIYDNTEEDDED